MFHINDNFCKLAESYLFSEVGRRINAYKEAHPDADVIRMGIGDVTRPLCPAVVEAMHKAVDDEAGQETFHGYGPEQGYAFLRDAIAEYDYRARGVEVAPDEIFISDGAKSDTGNIGDILARANRVAVTDPDNGFVPALPKETADVIYLCYPNNPTGTALTRSQLKVWVDYALEHKSLILYDSAYEAFIRQEDVPHSIYEIEGARKVAIEFRSFSKTAGFTGVRCAYTVVPKELLGYDEEGKEVSMNHLWNRRQCRQCTKFNGASYVSQRAAAAIYTPEGKAQTRATVDYYMRNASLLCEGLKKAGLEVFGGVNAPYVWIKTPAGMDSWKFFDLLLDRCHVAGTPGSGFGPSGEGYIRLTAFNTYENTAEAVRRIAGARFGS